MSPAPAPVLNGHAPPALPDAPSVSALKAASRKERNMQRFLDVFPILRDDLVAHLDGLAMPADACAHFAKNLDYNVPHGKLNRGMAVVDTVEILRNRPLTDDEYFKAAVLGWCVELLQAFFLVSDDMMDSSITRRGQPCWYRVPHIGTIAINDAFLLETSIYFLLKKHFRSESYYLDLYELFHETTLQTEIGQLIDLITAPEDHVDLSKFSLEKHRLIVVYKTAYYSFYLPVALAMHACGITDPAAFALAQRILVPLGEYFQVQDDYLDCYGAPEFIGKIGTDILDNKCSWNVNVALAHATPADRALLDAHYGRKDAADEAIVKEVFERVGLREKYAVYEEQAYASICALIDEIPTTPVPAEPLVYVNGHTNGDAPSITFNGNGNGHDYTPPATPNGHSNGHDDTPSATLNGHSNGHDDTPSTIVNGQSNGHDGPHSPEPVVLKREVFLTFLEKIYKRTK